MILLLSPSKTLDYDTRYPKMPHTLPVFLKESRALVKTLQACSQKQIMQLMDISEKLSALNVQRYRDFKTPFTPANARQAILAFKGDVYDGIDVENYAPADFDFAQAHVRILSGLYGLLRPLDLMQPYRLEMGTRLKTARGRDLYAFWGSAVTQEINRALAAEKSGLLVNLASEEYFKAVKVKELEGRLLNVTFKENHKGSLKIIGLMAKKARGLMTDFVVRGRISDAEGLKAFNTSGYRFEKSLSSAQEFTFVR